MVEVKGLCGITAKILADSTSVQGTRLTTYEVQYPRLIHQEVMTHRMLSKNSASSRAIPFAKMQEQLTGRPVRFGAAKAGMQDGGEHNGIVHSGCDLYEPADIAWETARDNAVDISRGFLEAGFAKQVYNRLTEPFQMMKTVISGTEWGNFFFLRNDAAADPTIAELARCMQEAREASTPQLLKAGQWHLPYLYADYFDIDNGVQQFFYLNEGEPIGGYLSIEEAIKVSCARCAAVSYRNEGYGMEKSLQLYERLVGADKKHASALEHCATPMGAKEVRYINGDWTCVLNVPTKPTTWQKGISHMDRDGQLWSANFKGWVQHRKTIIGENHTS